MTSRSYAHRCAAVAAACLGLALPAAIATSASAANSSGGSGSSGGAGLSGGTPTGTTPTASPLGGPVSADGDGITLDTAGAGTYKKTLSFTGTVASSDANDELAIQRENSKGLWQTVAESPVQSSGAFTVNWKPNTSGIVAFRAALEAPAGTASASSAAPESSSPALSVTIYQDSIATIYGPGFYGHKTACGETLTPSTMGVASRTLKCGTKVSIVYNGQTITVPVIDRGPFANGATWDLTEATAQALSDSATETVGAAVL